MSPDVRFYSVIVQHLNSRMRDQFYTFFTFLFFFVSVRWPGGLCQFSGALNLPVVTVTRNFNWKS